MSAAERLIFGKVGHRTPDFTLLRLRDTTAAEIENESTLHTFRGLQTCELEVQAPSEAVADCRNSVEAEEGTNNFSKYADLVQSWSASVMYVSVRLRVSISCVEPYSACPEHGLP